jgi:hypothetical protein
MASRISVRSHFGNPHVTAGRHKTAVTPSSPAKTSNEDATMVTFHHGGSMSQTDLLSWDFGGSAIDYSSPTHATHLITRPQGIVTPDHSFGEREQGSGSPSSVHPLNLPMFLPGSSHNWRSARRVSVGLPSQYPTHDRNNSLTSSILEELQDFDEFFESSVSLQRTDCMELDIETKMSPAATTNPETSSCRECPIGQSRHKRRSRNHAMGTKDFYDKVLKEL